MNNWILNIVFLCCIVNIRSFQSPWQWECNNGKCDKKEITNETEQSALSFEACRMFCSTSSGLWPIPTGDVNIGRKLVAINPHHIDVNTGKTVSPLVKGAVNLFKDDVATRINGDRTEKSDNLVNKKNMIINIHIEDLNVRQLHLDTDESYRLTLDCDNRNKILVSITAETFFGSRHALETLGQLIIYDDLRSQLMVPANVNISDKPAYPYRGILLDTSRNYVSVDVIKRTINGMAASKLNTFHWHITDSQSFPYVSKSHPELSHYGAYSHRKVYNSKDIREIIEFAKIRGVRVLPEFDAPAHVGEGWQKSGFVVCFNAQPWSNYCVEPPCGQFDPTQEALYDTLEDLYGDFLEQFNPDIFHMGGDEVHYNCWNSTPSIVDWMAKKGWGRAERDFTKLWNVFQSKALERLHRKADREIPVIMWTSTLTKKEYLLESLPKDKYIIQIWTTGNDAQVKELLDNDYRVILSNYDALYFDCGFSGWVTDGNNWCSPYIGWQKVYDNSPALIAGDRKNQVLGSEATLWTEQVDSTSVDSRLWPRAAAMAETLWSAPTSSWKAAEQRMLIHRERLVSKGIDADALEPEWCLHNSGQCPL